MLTDFEAKNKRYCGVYLLGQPQGKATRIRCFGWREPSRSANCDYDPAHLLASQGDDRIEARGAVGRIESEGNTDQTCKRT
jgi:hypothetical protein